MKKLLFVLMFSFSLATIAHAQDSKEKAKATSSVPQKAHNLVSKHKKHNGYKVKGEHHGKSHKVRVNTKKNEVKAKTDKES
ncbi:MAG: hypothetical protein ACTHOB_00170 [Ginsengibacter sp.]|jgi:Ni/Co efflux regulator RcnB